MRIISGKYGGKIINEDAKSKVRPTKEKVRESFYSSIQSMINDSVVLDLFSGTGSIGLEAISRGAKKAFFVENNKKTSNILKENLKKILEDDYSSDHFCVFNLDYIRFLRYAAKENIKFDLIYIDPPYLFGLYQKVFDALKKFNVTKSNTLIIVERDKYVESPKTDEFVKLKSKKFGNTVLDYFVKD